MDRDHLKRRTDMTQSGSKPHPGSSRTFTSPGYEGSRVQGGVTVAQWAWHACGTPKTCAQCAVSTSILRPGHPGTDPTHKENLQISRVCHRCYSQMMNPLSTQNVTPFRKQQWRVPNFLKAPLSQNLTSHSQSKTLRGILIKPKIKIITSPLLLFNIYIFFCCEKLMIKRKLCSIREEFKGIFQDLMESD